MLLSTTMTAASTSPAASEPTPAASGLPVLSTLSLLQRLAADAGQPFNRAQARLLISEHFRDNGESSQAALTQLQQVLVGLGMLGRVRYLNLTECLKPAAMVSICLPRLSATRTVPARGC